MTWFGQFEPLNPTLLSIALIIELLEQLMVIILPLRCLVWRLLIFLETDNIMQSN